MAQFSNQEQSAMRREAVRRAQEMQKRVHPPTQQTVQRASYADYPPNGRDNSNARSRGVPPPPVMPTPPPTPSPAPPPTPSPTPSEEAPKKLFGIPKLLDLQNINPTELLSKLDTDHMMILALIVMIYKDKEKEGIDHKLLMALAYLLT